MWLESAVVHHLASFMGFYLNLVCDNVITVNTNSSSEIFEQIIRIGEGDVIIGISFPKIFDENI